VAFEEMMIDSISMKLVTAPQQFDVVVTTNQFGARAKNARFIRVS
jgi:isocitrate/isopropylmalate dehydrogenase